MAKERGRPTKYKPELHLPMVELMAEMGLTKEQIAERLEIAPSTLSKWMAEDTVFSDAVKRGREISDAKVEATLFQRAVGYDKPSVKIFMPAGASEPVYAPFMEHTPPDTTAMIFWLKNRKPKEWRDKHDVEHSGVVSTIDTSKLSKSDRDALARVAIASMNIESTAHDQAEHDEP